MIILDGKLSMFKFSKSGSCHGDEGGPLFSRVNGTLLGVISFGGTTCGNGEADVEENIVEKDTLKWIRDTARP
jgi:secreted trypsin-like serine protease